MMLGVAVVAGATGLPSRVTATFTAAETAELCMSCVTAVFVNKPVTSEGVMSRVVNCEFGVLMVVSSNGVAFPPLRPPAFGVPPTVLMTHWVVETWDAKFPLLCAEANGDAITANATIIPGSNSL